MSRIVSACLLAAFSGASLAQMMGGSVATTPYFPLVDGARYDYMYTSGPWSTASATMHAGQTWAGVSGLTAMHTKYACNVGVTCAPDATDFFRMDPDGMHYFGGTGSNLTGTQYSMMSYSSPEWILKNPVTPGTMMGGGGYQNMEMWQAGVMGTNSMMGVQNYVSRYRALALETVSTPAGTFANALHIQEQRGSGYVRDVWYAPGVGMVKMADGTSTALLAGYTIPGVNIVVNDMIVYLEEPANGATASGISNLRGWAVSPNPIQRIDLYVDGSLVSTLPYGGTRADVGAAFPTYSGSMNSGFSMAYNYGALGVGSHTILARTVDNAGNFKDSTSTFNVVRFPSSFIDSPAEVSLQGTSTTIVDANTLRLNNVMVQGVSYNLTLRWNTATQGFALVGTH